MPYRMIRAEHLGPALDDGDGAWAEVDRAVERIVATRLRFDDVLSPPAPGRDVLAGPAHRALARRRRPSRWSSCGTSRWTGSRCCPWTRRPAPRWP